MLSTCLYKRILFNEFFMYITTNFDRLMAVLLRLPAVCFPRRNSGKTMALNPTDAISKSLTVNKKLPILLFDIMDTIVRDPFYHDVPAFFRMPMKELLEIKHPTTWIEFEKGLIDEPELIRKFFKDGRSFDLEGLKDCMSKGYSYIEGVEELLVELKSNNFEMHAFTNYPMWCEMIEDKLKVSRYLSWTFCSYKFGKRKPDRGFYSDVVKHLGVEPQNCIFIDDRMKNVEAAREVGLIGLQFKNVDQLRRDFSEMGIDFSK